MKKIRILVHTRTPEQAKFFFRIENEIKEYEFEYFTTNLITKLYLLGKNKVNYILKNKSLEIKNTVEEKFLQGEGINKNTQKVFWLTYEFLKNKKYDGYFVWNGSLASEKAFKYLSKTKNIPIIFFEIGNFNKKIFIDTEGTNKESSLYSSLNGLNWNSKDEEVYNQWKENYIAFKKKQKNIPQAKKKYIQNFIIKIIKYFFNILEKLLGIVSDQDISLKYILNLLRPAKILKTKEINLTKEKYIFFPMQVSNDSQVLLNSNIGVIEGLKIAYLEAKKRNLDLIVKLHPAEQNMKFLKKILLFCKKNKVKIVDENIYDLIINAEKVITINSTVGLEARILEKKVEFLGESFYKRMNEEHIKAYIINYLKEGDYFGKDKIPKVTIDYIKKLILLK